MKIPRALALALVIGVAFGTAAQATWWQGIQAYAYYVSEPLAHSNGQKIVTGRYNILHLVYEDNGVIKYTQSSDGLAWSAPTSLFCGNPGRLPAIAADPSGKLAVVWVDDVSTSIQYVYHDGSTWSMPVTLVADGDEPSIVARGGKSYVAWRTGASDRVQYSSFPLTAPTLITSPEDIDVASCATDNYKLPSIALVDDPCQAPIPVVGYLYSRTAPCMTGSSVGPRVCKRDNTLGTWSMTWQDPRTSTSTSVQSISLALSSRFSARELYVAYSDVQSSLARTNLGHGTATTWTWSSPAAIDNQPRHIHVRANEASSSPVGTFRLARTYFGSYGAEYRDGVWASPNPAPTWSTAWTGTTGPPAARPHAHWWKRCASGTQTDLRVVAEEDLCLCIPAVPAFLGSEVEQVSPCPPNPPIGITKYPCKEIAVAVGSHLSPGGSGPITVVDVSDAGVLKSVTDRGAVVTTAEGGRIDITWGSGKVVSSSEGTLALTSPPEAVRFSSSTVKFAIEQDGVLSGYDRAPGGGVCRR